MQTLSIKQVLSQGWNVFIQNILMVLGAIIILACIIAILTPLLFPFSFLSKVISFYIWSIWFLPQTLKLVDKQETYFSRKTSLIHFSLPLFLSSPRIILYILFAIIVPLVWMGFLYLILKLFMIGPVDEGVAMGMFAFWYYSLFLFPLLLLSIFLLYSKNYYLLSVFLIIEKKIKFKKAVLEGKKLLEGLNKEKLFKLLLIFISIGGLFLSLPYVIYVYVPIVYFTKYIYWVLYLPGALFIAYWLITLASVYRTLQKTTETASIHPLSSSHTTTDEGNVTVVQ